MPIIKLKYSSFGINSSRKQYCFNTSNEKKIDKVNKFFTFVSFLLEVAFLEEKHIEGRIERKIFLQM
jgi:hypothetical protein